MGWLTLAGCQELTKATLSLPSSPHRSVGRKFNKMLIFGDKDRERSLTDYHHGQNGLWKVSLIYQKSNKIKKM